MSWQNSNSTITFNLCTCQSQCTHHHAVPYYNNCCEPHTLIHYITSELFFFNLITSLFHTVYDHQFTSPFKKPYEFFKHNDKNTSMYIWMHIPCFFLFEITVIQILVLVLRNYYCFFNKQSLIGTATRINILLALLRKNFQCYKFWKVLYWHDETHTII